ncbi:MAG: DMT family transporter [Acidimicrobiales bacterium]
MSALAVVNLALHHHIAPGLVSIVLLSLASAAAYGLAAVLQHHEAAKQDSRGSGGLLARLLRQPVWLLGSLCDGAGYAFQFLALRRGSLALVEPILVLSLVFALPVAAHLEQRRVSSSDVSAAVTTVAGLSLFQAVARPGVGHPSAPALSWILLSAAVAVACALLTLIARAGPPRRAALLYAAASGTAFGYVAAVTERTGHLLDHGLAHVLASWAPYVLVAAAIAALALTQQAFNAGVLRLCLPTLTVVQPLVAMAIGVAAFGEHLRSRGYSPLAELLGLVVMVVGVYNLSNSPVLTVVEEAPPA